MPPQIGISIGIDNPPGGGFLPTQLSSNVLWLRADLGITLNGTDVSAWADQSGNGNNVSQGTALAQPAYITDVGGFPAVRFNGTDDFMTGTITGMTGDYAHTVFYAGKLNSVASGGSFRGALTLGGQAVSTGVETGGLTAGNAFFFGGPGLGGSQGVGSAANTDKHVFSRTYPDAIHNGYLDGALDATATGSISLTSAVTLGQRFDIGVSSRLQVEIYEVVVYSRVITTSERTLVAAYLKVRYGTP